MPSAPPSPHPSICPPLCTPPPPQPFPQPLASELPSRYTRMMSCGHTLCHDCLVTLKGDRDAAAAKGLPRCCCETLANLRTDASRAFRNHCLEGLVAEIVRNISGGLAPPATESEAAATAEAHADAAAAAPPPSVAVEVEEGQEGGEDGLVSLDAVWQCAQRAKEALSEGDFLAPWEGALAVLLDGSSKPRRSSFAFLRLSLTALYKEFAGFCADSLLLLAEKAGEPASPGAPEEGSTPSPDATPTPGLLANSFALLFPPALEVKAPLRDRVEEWKQVGLERVQKLLGGDDAGCEEEGGNFTEVSLAAALSCFRMDVLTWGATYTVLSTCSSALPEGGLHLPHFLESKQWGLALEETQGDGWMSAFPTLPRRCPLFQSPQGAASAEVGGVVQLGGGGKEATSRVAPQDSSSVSSDGDRVGGAGLCAADSPGVPSTLPAAVFTGALPRAAGVAGAPLRAPLAPSPGLVLLAALLGGGGHDPGHLEKALLGRTSTGVSPPALIAHAHVKEHSLHGKSAAASAAAAAQKDAHSHGGVFDAFPVVALPLSAEPGSTTKWSTGDAKRGVRALFEGALDTVGQPGRDRKRAALAHPSVQRALAQIVAMCLSSPRVRESVDGVKQDVTGQCLISQISPTVKSVSGFPLPLSSKAAPLSSAASGEEVSPQASAAAASSLRTISDLIKELGLGVIAVFDKDGLHGSRALGITEFGRMRIYDLLDEPPPVYSQSVRPLKAGAAAAASAAPPAPLVEPHAPPAKDAHSAKDSHGASGERRMKIVAVSLKESDEWKSAHPPMDLAEACASGSDDLKGDKTAEAIAAAVAHGCMRTENPIMQPKLCQWLIKRDQWPPSDLDVQRRALSLILDRHASDYIAQYLGGRQGCSPSDDGVRHYVGQKPGVTLAHLPLWSKGIPGGWGGSAPGHAAPPSTKQRAAAGGGGEGAGGASKAPSHSAPPSSQAPPPQGKHGNSSLSSLVLFSFNLVCKRAAENALAKQGAGEATKPVGVLAKSVADVVRVNLNELGDRATREHFWPLDTPEFTHGTKLTYVLAKVGEAYVCLDKDGQPQNPAAKLGPLGRKAFMNALVQCTQKAAAGKSVEPYLVANLAEQEVALALELSVAAALANPQATTSTSSSSSSAAASAAAASSVAAASPPLGAPLSSAATSHASRAAALGAGYKAPHPTASAAHASGAIAPPLPASNNSAPAKTGKNTAKLGAAAPSAAAPGASSGTEAGTGPGSISSPSFAGAASAAHGAAHHPFFADLSSGQPGKAAAHQLHAQSGLHASSLHHGAVANSSANSGLLWPSAPPPPSLPFAPRGGGGSSWESEESSGPPEGGGLGFGGRTGYEQLQQDKHFSLAAAAQKGRKDYGGEEGYSQQQYSTPFYQSSAEYEGGTYALSERTMVRQEQQGRLQQMRALQQQQDGALYAGQRTFGGRLPVYESGSEASQHEWGAPPPSHSLKPSTQQHYSSESGGHGGAGMYGAAYSGITGLGLDRGMAAPAASSSGHYYAAERGGVRGLGVGEGAEGSHYSSAPQHDSHYNSAPQRDSHEWGLGAGAEPYADPAVSEHWVDGGWGSSRYAQVPNPTQITQARYGAPMSNSAAAASAVSSAALRQSSQAPAPASWHTSAGSFMRPSQDH
jgi:hypothetical protein